ncbi:MAG: hypothetical protein H6553_06475 [Chitinophagales bacterium]|nr:hypothetical protein [Chitinophagales bacterium]
MTNGFKYIIYLFLFCLISCQNNHRQIDFYYWKQQYQIDSLEQETLHLLNTKTIYLHYFDVVWHNGKAVPKYKVEIKEKVNYAVVPTVYIENDAIANLSFEQIESLSKNMVQLIEKINQLNNIKAKTIQIDCDWTVSTKAKYFKLLTLLQENYKVTATIRLHQIKYKNTTGVPPVKKAVLMLYNMGDVKNIDEYNSILNINTTKKYIAYAKKYPIPLDYAFPIFSWTAIFRNNKLMAIKNNLRKSDFKTNDLKALNNTLYQVQTSQFLAGFYFMKNDIIRFEHINKNDLKDLYLLTKKNCNYKKFDIVLYHLDSQSLKLLSNETIPTIQQFN